VNEYYKPLPIYILDPLQYTTMALQILKGMNGWERWGACEKAALEHPDSQKIACIAHGAIIYTAPFPDRLAPDMLPPADWLHEAGITESTLWDAKKKLMDTDPNWQAKRDLHQAINEEMDQAQPMTKQ